MKKQLEYNLTHNLADLLKNAVRKKNDIVLLLLNALNIMLSDVKVADNKLGTFSIHIDKMSRIFFSTNFEEGIYNKNFSFTFPFTLVFEDEIIKSIHTTTSKIKLDRSIVRILLKLAEDDLFNNKDSNCSFYDELDNLSVAINIHNEIEDNIEDEVWTIAKELLLFEPGYLRYDFDKEREDPLLHPLHHIDVFFSSQATFKIGIKDSLFRRGVFEREDLINVLDISTPCYYLNLYD